MRSKRCDWGREDGLERTALALAGGDVDGRIERAQHGHDDDDERQDLREHVTADLRPRGEADGRDGVDRRAPRGQHLPERLVQTIVGLIGRGPGLVVDEAHGARRRVRRAARLSAQRRRGRRSGCGRCGPVTAAPRRRIEIDHGVDLPAATPLALAGTPSPEPREQASRRRRPARRRRCPSPPPQPWRSSPRPWTRARTRLEHAAQGRASRGVAAHDRDARRAHPFGRLLAGHHLGHQQRDERVHHQGEEQHHRQRSSVPQRLAQLLGPHDTNGGEPHAATRRRNASSRLEAPPARARRSAGGPSAIRRPSCIIPTRSHSSSASAR